MDREAKLAYEIVRLNILENIERLEKARKERIKLPSADVNDLKKWRRYGAAFTWDPEVFQDVLENPVMSDKKLLSSLRSKENQLMRNFGVIDKIPLHHIIANRTGGDLGIRTPIDQWLEVRDRVFQATGAKPGNAQANLNAAGQFDELAHLGRIGAKGSVFETAGGTVPKDFPVLHRAGQQLQERAGATPAIVTGSPAEKAKLLIPSVVSQQERFVETTATPQVQAQRQVLTRAGYPEAFAPETPVGRIQEIAKEIRGTDIPEQFAKAWMLPVNGSIKFNAGFGLNALKTLQKNITGAAVGALTSLDTETVKGIKKGKYKEVVEQAALGTAAGTAAQQLVTGSTQLGQMQRVAALGRIPGALNLAAGAARFAPPVLVGMAGYQALDVITTAFTDKTLAETGQAAEQTKEELRQQGMSEYQLRRRARTGR